MVTLIVIGHTENAEDAADTADDAARRGDGHVVPIATWPCAIFNHWNHYISLMCVEFQVESESVWRTRRSSW